MACRLRDNQPWRLSLRSLRLLGWLSCNLHALAGGVIYSKITLSAAPRGLILHNHLVNDNHMDIYTNNTIPYHTIPKS